MMKKLSLLLLICGMGFASMAQQVVNTYHMVVNEDASPLNMTIEDQKIIAIFNTNDVLTFTFLDLNGEIPTKSIEITSETIGTSINVVSFDQSDLSEDQSFKQNLDFGILMNTMPADGQTIYTIVAKDESGRQDLLRFKLM